MFKSGLFFGLTLGPALVSADLVPGNSAAAQTSLLNVSFDPAHGPYKDCNAAFAKHSFDQINLQK